MKVNFKSILILIITLVSIVNVISCKKSSQAPGLIVGNWLAKSQKIQLLSYNVITSDTTYYDNNSHDIFSLTSNGQWTSLGGSGSYTLTGNRLQLDFSNGNPSQVGYITTLTDDTLVTNFTFQLQGQNSEISIQTYTR